MSPVGGQPWGQSQASVDRWTWGTRSELMCHCCVPAVTQECVPTVSPLSHHPLKVPPPRPHRHLSGATITSPLSPSPLATALSPSSSPRLHHGGLPCRCHRCPFSVPRQVPPSCTHHHPPDATTLSLSPARSHHPAPATPPKVPPPCPHCSLHPAATTLSPLSHVLSAISLSLSPLPRCHHPVAAVHPSATTLSLPPPQLPQSHP